MESKALILREGLKAHGSYLLGVVTALALCFGSFGCASLGHFDRQAQTTRLIPGQIPEDLQLTDTSTLVSFPRTEVVETLEDQIGPGVGRFLASVPASGSIDSVPGEKDHQTMDVPSYFDLTSFVPKPGE